MVGFNRKIQTLASDAKSKIFSQILAHISREKYKSLVMLMTITTLHEFVHYGRDENNLHKFVFQDGVGREAGWVFETSIQPGAVSGTGINRNNAIEWVKYYEYNPN